MVKLSHWTQPIKPDGIDVKAFWKCLSYLDWRRFLFLPCSAALTGRISGNPGSAGDTYTGHGPLATVQK